MRRLLPPSRRCASRGMRRRRGRTTSRSRRTRGRRSQCRGRGHGGVHGVDSTAGDFPWNTTIERNLFRALGTEKIAMFVILALAIAIAAFNLVSILVVAVTELVGRLDRLNGINTHVLFLNI